MNPRQRIRIVDIGRLTLAVLLVAGLAAPAVVAGEATPAAPDAAGSPLPLTGERLAAFEIYVDEALRRFGIPGAAVAVVQGGDLVYLEGFGVTEVGGSQPVTPDTMMMIGSITKSMTTMLAAALVDAGRIGWDTPLTEILPDFAVADPALTERLTVRDAFCNCSGLPGPDIASFFQDSQLSPAEVVAALADVAPTAPFDQQFQYNNQLIAAGGYAVGAVYDDTADDLGLAYDTALRERVLDPIGMTHTTFDTDAVRRGNDYALPHAVDLSGDLRPLPLEAEQFVWSIRPAGGLWSNAREMARYLQTELSRGVAPDGTRVVSAENLETTWAPGIAVPDLFGGPPQIEASKSRYGLGWMSGDYQGLRVISHAGGTSGFSSEIAFLPEADLGIVVLANAQPLAPFPLAFPYAVQFRLFELLFDLPAEFDAAVAALPPVRPPVALGEVDAAAVTPYAGRYANPELGKVMVSLRDGRLFFATGEIRSELRPPAGESDDVSTFLFHDPPLSLYSEVYGVTITLAGGAGAPRLSLTIPANPNGPGGTYEFAPEA